MSWHQGLSLFWSPSTWCVCVSLCVFLAVCVFVCVSLCFSLYVCCVSNYIYECLILCVCESSYTSICSSCENTKMNLPLNVNQIINDIKKSKMLTRYWNMSWRKRCRASQVGKPFEVFIQLSHAIPWILTRRVTERGSDNEICRISTKYTLKHLGSSFLRAKVVFLTMS